MKTAYLHFISAFQKFFACLAAGVVALCFNAVPAQAACAVPTAEVGAIEWFSGDTKFKYCDGTNWNVFGAGSGYWQTTGTDLYYSSGNVGVSVTAPLTKVEVAGHIRIADNNLPCNGASDGALRYNSSTNIINYCDGTTWRNLAANGPPPCPVAEFTTPGSTTYTVLAGCTTLSIEVYGAGGGAAFNTEGGGGGGGSTRVDDNTPTTLALAGGGGGGAYLSYYTTHGGGGGGGYAQTTTTRGVGDILTIVVGEGGKNGCNTTGGAGGAPSGGTGGSSAKGGDSVYGGGGGGDYNYRGGNSTYGGAGGAGNASNSSSSTSYGGAGGSGVLSIGCGSSTYGTSCGGLGEGGGGGGGFGDVFLVGEAGGIGTGGSAASGGTGIGADYGTSCTTGKGGNGKVVIRPQ